MATDLLRADRTNGEDLESFGYTSEPSVLVGETVLEYLLKGNLAGEGYICADEAGGYVDRGEKQQDAGCGHVSEGALIWGDSPAINHWAINVCPFGTTS